ncbi:MAG: cytochrome c oxidase subunit II [Calditrichae bacterium]|nr:cytochrome c oxidase subunit II [Calditrichota bacterium]MCB9058038.1 cytochrome c oxidase subunit II [Calditrichia bacterium]
MDPNGTLFFPEQGSTIASEVDLLFHFVLYLSIFFFILVTGGSFYFAWRFRKKGEDQFTPNISHNTSLEIFWTVIPTILVFIIFIWGFKTYLKMNVTPANSMEVNVTAQKWFWTFGYKEGATTTNELVVPVNKSVKLLMSSQDVIHSFFVPAFRVKMDVLPNRYTSLWFEATKTGEFDLFCTEYCGKGHSEMIGKVKVLSDAEFASWLASSSGPSDLPPAEYGKELYKSKACFTCHSIDGTPSVGPTFKGVFGRTEELTDGSSITVDENYIRHSILEPQSQVVKGFQPVMPTYQGVLNSQQIDALIAFLKTVK